ncbi:MAG: hypothetical protein HC908_14155 [Calothrix sp. SM1_7_51]|nr:hypothetical protein [Calothrix sp. SM1_7_51]
MTNILRKAENKGDLEKQSDSLDKKLLKIIIYLEKNIVRQTKKEKKNLFRRFQNLSISRKVLIAFFACELLPFFGIGSSFLTNTIINGSTHIENQGQAVVYLRQKTGEFLLATDFLDNKYQLDLPDKSILAAAQILLVKKLFKK